jgi:hypothetical protein
MRGSFGGIDRASRPRDVTAVDLSYNVSTGNKKVARWEARK